MSFGSLDGTGGSVPSSSQHYKISVYQRRWEQDPVFSGWLANGKNPTRARCQLCDVEMMADLGVLRSHAKGIKHKCRAAGYQNQLLTKPCSYNKKWEKNPGYRKWLRQGRSSSKAECSVCDLEMKAERTVVRNHAKSKRHIKAMTLKRKFRRVAKALKINESKPEPVDLVEVTIKTEPEDFENIPDQIHTVCEAGFEAAEAPVISEEFEASLLSIERIGNALNGELEEKQEGPDICIKGFKRAGCADCGGSMMESTDGRELCISCSGIEGASDCDSQGPLDFDVKEEVVMQIDDQKFCLEDLDPVVHEVVDRPTNHQNSSPNCLIQGVSFSSEVVRLVCVLGSRLASLNHQMRGGGSLGSHLSQLEKTLALLEKIKKL